MLNDRQTLHALFAARLSSAFHDSGQIGASLRSK